MRKMWSVFMSATSRVVASMKSDEDDGHMLVF
jgi:hypothetical protein